MTSSWTQFNTYSMPFNLIMLYSVDLGLIIVHCLQGV